MRATIEVSEIASATFDSKPVPNHRMMIGASAIFGTELMAATFGRSGDVHSSAVETVDSATDHIRLTWWDTVEPFVLTMAPGTNNRPIGVFSTFFPARSAQLELNGRFASGKVWAEMRGDRQGSSATLAWSETWVKPRS